MESRVHWFGFEVQGNGGERKLGIRLPRIVLGGNVIEHIPLSPSHHSGAPPHGVKKVGAA